MTEGKLEQMFRQQYEMQRDVYGIDYATLTDEERIHHFKEMLHAMNDEMHEALGEMGWKPWASSKHFNADAVQAELVDAWHFFMNLVMISVGGPETLFEGYQQKRLKNIARQQEGYDGVSTKCTKCKRAFDDEFVYCHQAASMPNYDCCHYQNNDGELVKRVQ